MQNFEDRIFKPGVYIHYKEGTKYLAYEDTTDEETGRPRISYFNIDKPEKKWNRKQEIFLAHVDQVDMAKNKTGQKFKFEFLRNEHPLYIESTNSEIIFGSRLYTLSQLQKYLKHRKRRIRKKWLKRLNLLMIPLDSDIWGSYIIELAESVSTAIDESILKELELMSVRTY